MQDILDNIEQENQETVKEKVIGTFKPKEKFIEFVGMKGNIHFIANEAFIEGKYLAGIDLDNITFKLTICDEGTVNFEEVDTDKTTTEQRERLLDVICEKTITPFNKKMVITDLPFKSVTKVLDKTINLYLSVDYTTPISKLASIFDDEVEMSDEQNSKLDDLLSLIDDDSDASEEAQSMIMSINSYEEKSLNKIETEETKREFEGENSSKSMLEESFKKMKEEKVQELQKKLEHQKSELKRFEYEKVSAEKKISDATTEIRVLESRIDSLKPNQEPNGYFFHVSERLNEKVVLEDDIANLIKEKVSKVKSINVEAFMKLFEQGEYHIKLGQKIDDVMTEVTDYESLSDDIKKTLSDIGISLIEEKNQDGDVVIIDKKLMYLGEMTWHEIVDKMIKKGFSQDPEFDKMVGSNSYFAMYGSDDKNESAEKQNQKNLDKKLVEKSK
jgi:hypothetical protein